MLEISGLRMALDEWAEADEARADVFADPGATDEDRAEADLDVARHRGLVADLAPPRILLLILRALDDR